MNTLIVGGTSGLGLEIARNEAAMGNDAIITGRHDPDVRFAEYREFDLTQSELPARIGQFVMELPTIDTLVYAAGYYQEGQITGLTDEQVDNMFDVGGRGLMFFTKKILEKQNQLGELVTITSTSQWTPREFEPVYNFVKAGAAHYSHGLSLDSRIGKTLVVGPSGMDTKFWNDTEKDTSKMMRPEWVAKRIMELRHRDDKYIFAKILGALGEMPQRVVIEEPAPVAEDVSKDLWPIGQVLAQRRNSLGLTVVEAAKLCGISRQMYSNYERGTYPYDGKSKQPWQPRAKSLIKLALAMGIDANALLKVGGYILPASEN